MLRSKLTFLSIRSSDKIGEENNHAIGHLLEGLKQQTVMTKWITAEVDRITALVYFMIIILLFITAPVDLFGFSSEFRTGFWEC